VTGTALVAEIMREVNDCPPFSYTYKTRPDDLLEIRASELEAILVSTIPTPDEWTLAMQMELEQARKQNALLDQANVTLSAENTELEEARLRWEMWAKEMERRVGLTEVLREAVLTVINSFDNRDFSATPDQRDVIDPIRRVLNRFKPTTPLVTNYTEAADV
jgi:hypothetical protein